MARKKTTKAVDEGKTQRQAPKRRAASRASNVPTNDAPAKSSSTSKPKTKPKPKKKMASSAGVKKSTPRRMPARSSKKDPWGEEQLTTSSKSRIIDVDLVRLLAKPEAWTCLNEDEKKEILALLPDDVHPQGEPDPEDPNYVIPPLPESFLRYSNNWRDGVRQFQLDLQAGKYDPAWQRQAAEAMEERAQGAFDKFKEEQFEEFWGQKQKMDRSVAAGESSKVKFEDLIKDNVIRVGDVWRFGRVFGAKGATNKVSVEKEVKIIEIDGASLTFLIPPGQRVFLRHDSQPVNEQAAGLPVKVAPAVDTNADFVNGAQSAILPPDQVKEALFDNPEASLKEAVPDASAPLDDTNDEVDLVPASTPAANRQEIPESSQPTFLEDISGTPARNGTTESAPTFLSQEIADSFENVSSQAAGTYSQEIPDSQQTPVAQRKTAMANETMTPTPASTSKTIADSVEQTPPLSSNIDVPGDRMDIDDQDSKLPANGTKNGTANIDPGYESDSGSSLSSAQSLHNGDTPVKKPNVTSIPPEAKPADPVQEIRFKDVTGPGRLENKILEIDGRIVNPPNGNAWKDFRCFRNNQDMGSLWEVRQAWFLKNK